MKNVKKENSIKTEKVSTAKKVQEWLKEYKEAIDKQNERIQREGLFSDAYRRF
ncbi:MAG: Unknown protein [uncultured Sulfurovum sp.]|uniref:Uncharacterized protein n=1 Tax=uncultured Sulfurovum sp. TaxID=269237 RepID=A0A6S6SCR8_9BACT|nr:MAG: Unknown protein [uncultured Sulfurovum sp.]